MREPSGETVRLDKAGNAASCSIVGATGFGSVGVCAWAWSCDTRMVANASARMRFMMTPKKYGDCMKKAAAPKGGGHCSVDQNDLVTFTKNIRPK